MNVLYLHQPGADLSSQHALIDALGGRHDLSVYDEGGPPGAQFKDQEVVIDMSGAGCSRRMIDAAVDTRLWQVFSTGVEDIEIDYMKSRGLIVTHCPGFLSGVPLAETAMMFMLMLARRFHESSANFRARLTYLPVGDELEGKVLAIVGFGGSGQPLARRAKAFGMRIHGIDVRSIEPEVLDEIGPEFMGSPDDLDRVIAGCDFLSLHLHVTEETRHIIDARRIALMKPTACVINVARGALVDERAMYDALIEGRLGGAGLDVFSEEPPDPTQPAFQLPNVFVTPHIAAETPGTTARRAQALAQNVDRVAQGLEPLHRIDR